MQPRRLLGAGPIYSFKFVLHLRLRFSSRWKRERERAARDDVSEANQSVLSCRIPFA